MSKRVVVSVALFLFAAGSAFAQSKGGKVPWKTDPQAAIAEAKARGMGMMLYFTSEG